jgi:Homeodomain-like domain
LVAPGESARLRKVPAFGPSPAAVARVVSLRSTPRATAPLPFTWNRVGKVQDPESPERALCLSNADRAMLGEIGHRLGRKALGEVANAALPDTILGWYRRLVPRKFDGSEARRSPGRPRVDPEVEQLIVRMAKENSSWGYDRIVGALANLGLTV